MITMEKRQQLTAPKNQAANNYIREAARFVAAKRYHTFVNLIK